MCDCYYHKCKECDITLPVHLGDYDTEREEIEVFCKDHIPEYNVRVFTVKKVYEDEESNFSEKNKVSILESVGSEDVFKKRMNEYEDNYKKVIDYYKFNALELDVAGLSIENVEDCITNTLEGKCS